MPAYNDLDLSRWREYDHIWTDSLWSIERRDDSYPKMPNFRGAFIPQVAEQLVWRYTRRGDLVLDMFVGSGTTAFVCARYRRKCIGIDIDPTVLAWLADHLGTPTTSSYGKATPRWPTS